MKNKTGSFGEQWVIDFFDGISWEMIIVVGTTKVEDNRDVVFSKIVMVRTIIIAVGIMPAPFINF